jgi:hypothetical protein
MIKLRANWSGVESAQPVHANQAIGQVGPQGSDGLPDGIYITMGSAAPPPLMDGDDAARARLIEKLTTEGLTVNVLGQYHVSRRMLDDFIAVLQSTAAKYDAVVQEAARNLPGAQGGGPA